MKIQYFFYDIERDYRYYRHPFLHSSVHVPVRTPQTRLRKLSTSGSKARFTISAFDCTDDV